MEGRKAADSSSASFTSELFGSKDDSSSSKASSGCNEGFELSNATVMSRDSLRSELAKKKSTDQPMHLSSTQPDDCSNDKTVVENQSPTIKDSSYYYEQRSQQPCHLSSSIYYGGQDVYHQPQRRHDSNYPYKKDGTDDDGTASRGNWWQGSLYY